MDDEREVKNTPLFKTKIGLVKGSVWLNDSYYSVTILRSYKDAEGNWHDTGSYGHDDLLNVAKVAERCETFIAGKR